MQAMVWPEMRSLTFESEPRARGLRFRRDRLSVILRDGRELSLPLALYPTLRNMTQKERAKWRLIGPGVGFRWPDYDLDLSVRGFLEGHREHVPPPSWFAKHPRPVDLRRAGRRLPRRRTRPTRATAARGPAAASVRHSAQRSSAERGHPQRAPRS